MSDDPRRLPYAISDEDDAEVLTLIESWRYRGPVIGWDAIVGHERQIRRCQEIVEAMRRPVEELERLHIRVGRGVVLVGPPGSGKTMMSRALAGALGRSVIAPPVSELTPGLIARLYAQLARMDPTVIVLDEAERVMGPAYLADDDCVRALCIALDGLERPGRAPITIALTTETQLSPTATRPGRLAPRLDLGLPTADERRILFERAIDGLPMIGSLDMDLVVERTGGWSGAELAVAVEEAMSRSLLDGTDALTAVNLLAILSERYVLRDPPPRRRFNLLLRAARHEAGHTLWGDLRWPGRVAMVTIGGGESEGQTRLDEEQFDQILDGAGYRDLAALALAGLAAEMIIYGPDHVSDGAGKDRTQATIWLTRSRELMLPYAPGYLEQGDESDRGSERMRAAIHAEMERDSASLFAEVVATLSPHGDAIDRLAQAIQEADDLTLSGEALRVAIDRALEPGRRTSAP